MPAFNSQVKQILILSLLLALIILVIREIYIFLPGLLGALTLYILSRGSYFQLIYHRKWRRGWAAGFMLLFYSVIIGLLIYLAITLLAPKVQLFLQDPQAMINTANEALAEVQKKSGIVLISRQSIADFLNNLSVWLPRLINSTANLITNIAVMLFILYYMLVHGKEMEKYLDHIIPLKHSNVITLATETKKLVRASALGIPFISLIQGLTATLGYYIFDVGDYVLWGFLTGLFAFFPVIGTMIIWVPLVVYMYADHQAAHATGLLFYSLIVTGNVDYLARITILKKWGNVHPVVTVIGVIAGLSLFGFIGFIFGPLLVNYIILLFKIYQNEFIHNHNSKAGPG